MSGRGYLVLSVLAGALVLPVVIGASCPPPSNPAFISFTTGISATGLRVLPCEPNKVCVDVINQACVDAEVILYTHDGYDLAGEYVTRTAIECCENENADAPCPCYRPGFDIGEMQLRYLELFRDANRTPFDEGGETVTLLEAETGRERAIFDCDKIKSIGIEVGDEGDLPGFPEEQSSVYYRCTMIEVDRAGEEASEHVACGATIQFRIYDRNECAHPELTMFRIDMETSQDCSDVEQTADTTTGGFGGG